MFVLSELLASPLSTLFVGYDKTLYDLTLRGFIIYSFSFLFSGIAIFGSAFFTALNNGPVSAIISSLRTIIFQVLAVIILPIFLGIDGIWLSVAVAELLSVIVTVVFILAKKKKYGY